MKAPTNCYSIANTAPKWFTGRTIKELCPGQIVWNLKDGKIKEAEYTQLYINQLNDLITAEFDFSALEGKTLLCWCPKDEFCHRRILGLLLRHASFEVDLQ